MTTARKTLGIALMAAGTLALAAAIVVGCCGYLAGCQGGCAVSLSLIGFGSWIAG